MAAHQALPSLGFSRQEHWSGCSQATSGHYFSGSWSKQPGTEHHTLAVSDCHCGPRAQLLKTQVFVFLYMRLCMHAKSLQSRPTLCNPMSCSPPGSSVKGILQARILEWVAVLSSRGSSQPKDWTWVSYVSCCIGSGFFTTSAAWEACFSLYIHKEIQSLAIFLKIIFLFLLFVYLIHILFFEKNFLPTYSHMSLVLPLPQFSHYPTLWYLLFLLFQPHQSSTGALIGQGRGKGSRWSQNLLSSLNTVNDPPILLASTDLQEGGFF